MNSLKSLAALQPVRCRWVAAVVMPVAFMAAAYGQSASTDAPVFEFEQRSTIDTIPFRSIAEEALANTVIEGGLEAPAAGELVQSARDDDVYLDPLALQPQDSRTDLGRSEIPVEFRFSNPKMVPGQSHSNNYSIRPPENRTYDSLNVKMTER